MDVVLKIVLLSLLISQTTNAAAKPCTSDDWINRQIGRTNDKQPCALLYMRATFTENESTCISSKHVAGFKAEDADKLMEYAEQLKKDDKNATEPKTFFISKSTSDLLLYSVTYAKSNTTGFALTCKREKCLDVLIYKKVNGSDANTAEITVENVEKAIKTIIMMESEYMSYEEGDKAVKCTFGSEWEDMKHPKELCPVPTTKAPPPTTTSTSTTSTTSTTTTTPEPVPEEPIMSEDTQGIMAIVTCVFLCLLLLLLAAAGFYMRKETLKWREELRKARLSGCTVQQHKDIIALNDGMKELLNLDDMKITKQKMDFDKHMKQMFDRKAKEANNMNNEEEPSNK